MASSDLEDVLDRLVTKIDNLGKQRRSGEEFRGEGYGTMILSKFFSQDGEFNTMVDTLIGKLEKLGDASDLLGLAQQELTNKSKGLFDASKMEDQLSRLGLDASSKVFQDISKQYVDVCRKEMDQRQQLADYQRKNLIRIFREELDAREHYVENLVKKTKKEQDEVLTRGHSETWSKGMGKIKKWFDAFIGRHGTKKDEMGMAINDEKGDAILTKFGKKLDNIAKGFDKMGGVGVSGVLGWIDLAFSVASKIQHIYNEQKRLDIELMKNEIALRKKLLDIMIQYTKTNVGYRFEVNKLEIDTMGQIMLESKGIANDYYAGSHDFMATSLTNIKAGAYAAAEKVLSSAAAYKKFKMNEDLLNKTLNYQKESAKEQNQANKAGIEQQKANAEVQKTNADAMTHLEKTLVYTDAAADVGGNFMPGVKSSYQEVAKLFKLNQEQENTLREFETDITYTYAKAVKDTTADMMKNMTSMISDSQKKMNEMKEKDIETGRAIMMSWLKLTETVVDKMQEAEVSAYKMGRQMGFSGDQLKKYSKTMADFQEDVADYGKTLQDMEKLQTSFQENTGRNRHFLSKDYTMSFGAGVLMGDDTISQFNSGMEIFNAGVADSNERLLKMFQQVSKIGLNGVKYAKDLVKNLGLAEKYHFKGGTRGLMDMVKWAQQVRFNMDSLGGMLEKVQEGGLENLVQMSAELQVLGGGYAMGADPMAIGWEAFMDPAALAKRYNNMFAGEGWFDPETGELNFGVASMMRMRQFAKSTGMDFKDVQNQARQADKMNRIGGLFTDTQNFNENQKALVANNAYWENGEWKINVGKEQKSIGQLNAADLEFLTPEDKDIQKGIFEKVTGIWSYTEMMKNRETKMMASMEKDNWTEIQTKLGVWTDTIYNEFTERQSHYNEYIQNGLGIITESQTSLLARFKAGDTEVDKMVTALGEYTTTLNGYINELKTTYEKKEKEIEGKNNFFTTFLDGLINWIANGKDRVVYLKGAKNGAYKEDITLQNATTFTKEKNKFLIDQGVKFKEQNDSVAKNPEQQQLEESAKTLYGGKQANDGVLVMSDSGRKLVKFNEQDELIGFQTGGPVSQMFTLAQSVIDRGGGGTTGPTHVVFSGSIQLNAPGVSVDIIKDLVNDPITRRSIFQGLSTQAETKQNCKIENPFDRNLVWNNTPSMV